MNTGTIYAVVQETSGGLKILTWAWGWDGARSAQLTLQQLGIQDNTEIIETHLREVKGIKHYNTGYALSEIYEGIRK